MGFNSVYKSLLEVFPQVDSRILKAVAIEHPKDADAAVEFVISDVLSRLEASSLATSSSSSSSTRNDNIASCSTSNSLRCRFRSPVGRRDLPQPLTVEKRHSIAGIGVSDEANRNFFKALCIESNDANENYHSDVSVNDMMCLDEPIVASSVANIDDEDDCEEVVYNSETGDWEPASRYLARYNANNATVGLHQGSQSASSSVIKHEEAVVTGCTNDAPRAKIQDLNENVAFDSQSSLHSDFLQSLHSDFLQDESRLENNKPETESRIATFLPDSSAVLQGSSLHSDFLQSLHSDFLQDESRLENNKPETESRIATFLPDSSAVLQGSSVHVDFFKDESRLENNKPDTSRIATSLPDSSAVLQGSSVHVDFFKDESRLENNKPDTSRIATSLPDSSAVRQDSSVHCAFFQDESRLENNKPETESRIATFLPDSSAVLQELPDSSVSEFEKPGSSSSLDNGSEQVVCDSEIVDVEDESLSATIVTRSGQVCRIDLFEDAIRDAKSNKQTLFLAMETVINLMKEVELQEKAAEQAKEEAARGGLDILARVEDLKQMLQHAKEANDMHSGEVYGEKAILATEMRELHTRLIGLSDERDKSLAILDEMSQTLEARLAAAEEMRKAAEKEKDGKEAFARRALAEQELIMDKVVQESKLLQVEAEENSKLREFLMDRGHLVDTLQGEIAVICQDVKLLKEKFDERVPISKSLYSSQTSCLLAASASSGKGIASDWAPEEGDSTVKSIASDWVPDASYLSETPTRVSPASSVHDHPQNNTFDDKGIIGDDLKELSDDEWDMFDARDAVEA